MKAAGTFAGIAGFELGFMRAGMEHTALCEIIPHRQRVLARQFPTTPIGGDIREVHGRDLGTPDVVVGGFPCKDLSIAKGKRKGLKGDDSKLFWEFHRLVEQHLRLVDETRARWVVLENTPGLLSFNRGRDHATVLRALEQLGYGWAFRVVDARSFGSAQKRPRVVIVGHRGGDPRPAGQVLGLIGPGAEVDAQAANRIADTERGAASTVSHHHGGLIRVWRKSVNPRVSIEKGYEGGYRETWVDDNWANTLASSDGGNSTRQKHLITQDGRLRTLTPVEWERLSGFPDGWTEGIPRTERYQALGDCFHVDVAEWLGHQLRTVHESVPMLPAA